MLSRFLWHWLVLGLGLYLITLVRPLGITYDRPEDLVGASLVLIIVNAILRPVIVFITFPIILLSLGLFLLVINGLMLELLPYLVRGFHVPGFWAAFWGALLLSLITTVLGRWEKRTIRRQAMACQIKPVESPDYPEIPESTEPAKPGQIIDI